MTIPPSELKHYTEANRGAWNEVMPFHQQAAKEKWDQLFLQPGFVGLDPIEVELLERVGLQGKNVIHLCCNNGIELLSLKNLGAGECVGVDISDEAVREARERAARSGIDCQFIRSDVYELDAGYNSRFDLVYISAGCLGWMPDLELFFQKSADLLRPGGLVFLHEIHPFSEMLPPGGCEGADCLRIVGPYFKKEPYIEQGGLDYLGNTEYASTTTQYWFVHTLSAILGSLIGSRILIEHFSEYDTSISPHQRPIEETKAGIPLSYILIASRP